MSIQRVVVAGSRGNIGSYLCQALTAKGYEVTVIREPDDPFTKLTGSSPFGRKVRRNENPRTQQLRQQCCAAYPHISWHHIRTKGLPGRTDAVINLAGDPVYHGTVMNTKRFRRGLEESRIGRNNTLYNAMKGSERPPKAFLSASAVWVYEVHSDTEYTDTEPLTHFQKTYMPALCRDWEESARQAEEIGTRVVNLRFGYNIAHDIERSLLHDNTFLKHCSDGYSAVLGAGTQPFPWIHIQDSIGIILMALENSAIEGPVNVVAPTLETNQDWNDQLGKAFGKTLYGHPRLSLNRPDLSNESSVHYHFGDDRAAQLLQSQKVIPKKVLDAGYQFKYPTLATAVPEVVSRYNDMVEEAKNPPIPTDAEVDEMRLNRVTTWVLKKGFAHLRAKKEKTNKKASHESPIQD